MITIYKPDKIQGFVDKFETRRQDVPQDIRDAVGDILQQVRRNGDQALLDLTLKFDKSDLAAVGLKVDVSEIEDAVRQIPAGFMAILEESAANIRKFHEKYKLTSWLTWEENGTALGQKVTALERVGIYVPGGRAAYPSSLLMAAMPAQAAGVQEIAVVTPPGRDGRILPVVLAAAKVAGITEIYRIGGAQAIAALAYGTETIRKVDKVAGPGNIYVAEAKRQVYGIVDIDMIAGPSEVVILADRSAHPDYVAADLLAQAEHDPLASAICITDSPELADRTKQAVLRQAADLNRKAILTESLRDWSGILVTGDWDQAVALTNRLAPEHLGLHVTQPWELLSRIRNAGAIFLGHHAPETVGDYWAGPNHVLPTNQTARFASPLNTTDFQKVSSIIQYGAEDLRKNANKIMTFANMEGLDGHANAVRQRLD